MPPSKSKKIPFSQQVAENLIEQLEKIQASGETWKRPWASSGATPHNPVSGSVFRGINRLHLTAFGHDDPRWLTYKQAQSKGWQVRGETKAATVQFWKWEEIIDKKNDAGKIEKVRIKLKKPQTFYAKVFHASDIEGIPEYVREPISWDPVERVDTIAKAVGVPVIHGDINEAFYRPLTDEIYMPRESQFPSAEAHASILMHEIGHSTGHESRLDRGLSDPTRPGFGSPEYALEELHADVFASIMCQNLGLEYDTSNHACYIKSWLKKLKDDPYVIFRAASTATKMMDYVLNLEQEHEKVREENKAADAILNGDHSPLDDIDLSSLEVTHESPSIRRH